MTYGNSIAYTTGPGFQATPAFTDPIYPPNPRYPTVDPGYGPTGPAFPPGPSTASSRTAQGNDRYMPREYNDFRQPSNILYPYERPPQHPF